MEKSRKYRVLIVAPTCFYYQAPLFRALAANDRIDLMVYFCSDEGVSGKDVKSVYGSDQNWGTRDSLLDGYRYKFLKNHSPRGSYLKSLVGLANLGIWKDLSEDRPDVVVVMSWMNPTWWLTFLACLKLKIPLLFMTDANIKAELLKSPWKSWIKRRFLGGFVFPNATGYLCAGTANQQLYAYYGVPNEKLVLFAYSWGYETLLEEAQQLRNQKAELRKKYGLPEDAIVILYCGRFSEEKGSLDLMIAFMLIPYKKKALVLVGDGRLRASMEEIVDRNGVDSVYFMGFQNRSEMGQFYALADLLVLPSHRETWGMVVNEALCFSLPVVVSDQVGAGLDLVVPGDNGHVFPNGDVPALAEQITKLIELRDEDRSKMGKLSLSFIKEWTSRDLGRIFSEYLDSLNLSRN